MDSEKNRDLMAIRDLQEIKITLKTFSQNSIDQLQLLRETLTQIVAEETSENKKIAEIDFLLKDFKKSLEENNKNIRLLCETIDKIESKTVDRNNKDAIIISVEKLKKTTEELNDLMKTTNIFLIDSKTWTKNIETGMASMGQEIKEIIKNLNKALDTKKNLSWWIDWIYKILLTIGLIYGFFFK